METCYATLAQPESGTFISSKHRDPNPKDNSLIRKDTSKYKGFHSTFAALFSYSGVSVRVRVPLFATHFICMIGDVPEAL